jgi:hypothetical protein
MNINVYPIKILLDTNIPGLAPFALTRELFYDPEKKNANSVKKDDDEDEDDESGEEKDTSESSSYPLFTFEVVYPLDTIRNVGMDFFFDKALFIKTLKGLKRTTIDMEKHENAKENVLTTLKVLFPTNFPTEGNIHVSFDENIQKTPTVSDESIPIIPQWILKYFMKSSTNYSYLEIGGEPYTLYRITWVNDFINHPEYKKLIDINTKNEKLKNKQIPNLRKELDKKIGELNTVWDNFLDKIEKDNGVSDASDLLPKIQDTLNEYKKRSSIMINIIPRLLASIQKILQPATTTEAIKSISEELYKINNYLKKANDAIGIDITPFQFESAGFKEFIKRGIHVYYMNKIIEDIAEKKKKSILEKQEEDEDEDFQHELSKYNYSDFKHELKSYISPIRSSSNIELQKMIYKDANPRSKIESQLEFSKFLNYINESYLSKHNKPQNIQLSNLLDIGVNIINSEKTDYDSEEDEDEDSDTKNNNVEEKTNTTLEIYLQLDLIKGILTDEVMSRIECDLRGLFLVKMYKELKLKDTDSFKLNKHRILININDIENEIKKTEDEALNEESKSGKSTSFSDSEQPVSREKSSSKKPETKDDYEDDEEDYENDTLSEKNTKGGKINISKKRKSLLTQRRKTKRIMNQY